MSSIKVDKYLATDENVLGEYDNKKAKEKFVATDRRLIQIRKGSMVDASYNHITSISMETIKHKGLIVLGAILFLIGIVLSFTSGVTGIAVIVIGLILIALYFVYNHAVYYISLSSGQKIKFPTTKSSNAENFIKIIRDNVR